MMKFMKMVSILGDSGGGLIIKDNNGRWTLRGLVSAAIRGPDGSCDLENYVVFTDVARHIDWIKRFI
jgi:secreted trypsin-like serine protease